eukprot:Rhum_TRINITY_DN15339_c4_g1::Rhum_TRINITY_DN15339_c4_g1_i1::g.150913::m.150913/K19680/TRAF3IP1, IFT54; TRAF3-interacting protein 1
MAEPEDIDPSVLEKTKKELGALIKAPRLSDKLLKKPPFRFLHDIVTNVIKTTGFASKLYTPDEMDSAKVQEKDAKLHFLQKIISSVNYTLKLQPPLAAKPVKIVSGLEAQHTNEFLQKLAAATTIPINKSDRAIDKVLARFADKAEQARKESQAGGTEAAAKAASIAEAEKAKVASETTAAQQKISEEEQQQKAEAASAAAAAAAAAAKEKLLAEALPPKDGTADEPSAAAPSQAPTQPAPIERRERETKKEAKKEEVQGPLGVIVEGERGDGTKGMMDTDSEDEPDPTAEEAFHAGGDGTVGGEDEGYLAQQLAAKKAAEEEKQRLAKEAAEKAGTGEDTGIRLQTTRHKAGKEREVFSTEVAKLKDSLQTLVKITDPLGKTFDYLQEDLDSMSKEKAMWQRQATDTKVQAQEAEHATEESLQPLYSQLQDLEDAISDQLNKIHTTRANILKNDGIVETLLRMVAS